MSGRASGDMMETLDLKLKANVFTKDVVGMLTFSGVLTSW